MFSIQYRFFEPIRPCTQQDFWQVVRSEKVRQTCLRCRALCTELAEEEACMLPSAEKIKSLKSEYSRLKKGLPIFCFQATFPLGKRAQADARLNGLYMVDFDHVGADVRHRVRTLMPQMEQRCAELGILLMHETPSGRGLRVVARAAAERGPLADQQAWMAQQMGLQHDAACHDASRSSFAAAVLPWQFCRGRRKHHLHKRRHFHT